MIEESVGRIALMRKASIFCGAQAASTLVRCWSFISLFILVILYSPVVCAQQPLTANRSVDEALDSVVPLNTLSVRKHSRLAFFISNRRIDLTAEERARSNHDVVSYEDVFLNRDTVGASYGYVVVSYPANRRRGDTSHGMNSTANPLYHLSVAGLRVLDSPEAFRDAIHQYFPSNNDKALLYIHGLDNTFADAAETIVQLATDLQFAGLPLFLSWPSDVARVSRYIPYTSFFRGQYLEAKNMSANSRRYAVLAMNELAGGVRKPFEIVAHSMGTDIAANAVLLRESSGSGTVSVIPHSIILAAPDISTSEFDARLRPAIVRPGRHVVVYCSNDGALLISSIYNFSDERLGYCTPGQRPPSSRKPPMSGIDLVIVRGIVSEFAQHSYYLTAAKILDDIQESLSIAVPPTAPVQPNRREITLP
jgi:esterase/lipase superfamily enzyme